MHEQRPSKPKIVPLNHGCLGHLTLCFLKDGQVNFYPEHVLDPEYLAKQLLKLCKAIHRNPLVARCAFNVCDNIHPTSGRVDIEEL